MARFAVVGLLGLAVNNVLLWLLTAHAGLYYLASSAIATEVAIVHNFILNHRWTFGSSRRAASVDMTFLRYNAVALGGLALTVGVLFVLTHFAGMFYLLANPLAVAAGAIWNYLMCLAWIWNTRQADQSGAWQ